MLLSSFNLYFPSDGEPAQPGAAVGFPVSVRKREKLGEFLRVGGGREGVSICSSLMLSVLTLLAKRNAVVFFGDKSDPGRRLYGPKFDAKPGGIKPKHPICVVFQTVQDAQG